MYLFAWFKHRCKLFQLKLQTNLDLLGGLGLGGHPAAAEGTFLGAVLVEDLLLNGTSAPAHAASTAGISRAIIN